MNACQLFSFSMKDVYKPLPERTLVCLSAVINFAKFREERLAHYQQMAEESVQIQNLIFISWTHSLTEPISCRVAIFGRRSATSTRNIAKDARTAGDGGAADSAVDTRDPTVGVGGLRLTKRTTKTNAGDAERETTEQAVGRTNCTRKTAFSFLT